MAARSLARRFHRLLSSPCISTLVGLQLPRFSEDEAELQNCITHAPLDFPDPEWESVSQEAKVMKLKSRAKKGKEGANGRKGEWM